MNCHKFISKEYSGQIDDCIPLYVIHKPLFSTNPEERIFGYHSTITIMLQLAYCFNYKTVLLVGFDHRYNEPRGRRQWHSANQDNNHFTKNYYPEKTVWKAPDLYKLADWLQMAKSIFESSNRKIINLTANTALNVFERDNIKNW